MIMNILFRKDYKITMQEAQYFKTVYNKFWVNQTKKYGYTKYERYLVGLISKVSPEHVFEVGIGTGWPIGIALKKKGIEVDGCDLAESSVELARKELNNVEGIWVGDVLEYSSSKLYDVTYCVRVSWYIPNFYETIDKMILMTKPGGYIIFDVMDKNNIYWLKFRWTGVKEKYYKFLGIDVEERFGTHYVSLMRMKMFLTRRGLSYQSWGEREITHNPDKLNTPKVVFCCRKEQ